MAKQRGILKLEGTLGDITFLKTKDGYLAKEATRIPKERILNDPAFARTRENMQEFGRAGKAGKLLRTAFRQVVQEIKDSRLVSRLSQQLMHVIKADSTHARGARVVTDDRLQLLRGFDFNGASKLSSSVAFGYEVTFDRNGGDFGLILPAFTPIRDITAPQGTTHFKLVGAASETDFAQEQYVTKVVSTDFIAYDAQEVAVQTLTESLTANSSKPVIMGFGIQLYQEVNGMKYSLRNGAYNAFAITHTDVAP